MRAALLFFVNVIFAYSALAADFSGTWSGEVELANGQKLPFVAILEQSGDEVTGILAGIGGAPDVEIIGGHVDDDLLRFSGVRMIQDAPVEFQYFAIQAGDDVMFMIYRVGAEGPNALLNSLTTRQN